MKKIKGRFASWVILLILVLQVIIFAPNVGKGFVTDDFNWLESVVRGGRVEYLSPFTQTTGFFRPLVGISFGLQYQLHGMEPKAFGLFNLFIHLLNIILVYLLFARWDMTRSYALWVTVLFALNAKAANMAVGWISGRTTLLFSLFMLLSLYIYLRFPRRNPLRFVLAALFYFAALLSKETAAVAPVFVFFFAFWYYREGIERRDLKKRLRYGLDSTLVFIIPLVVYIILRLNSDAMTPFNSPEYYRYSLSLTLLLKNVIEYIIRAGLLDIYLLFLLTIILLCSFIYKGKREKLKESPNFKAMIPGFVWFICLLLPVLPLVARSDLYAYLPQLGIHVMALTVIFSLWKQLNIKKGSRRNAAWILVCIISMIWVGYLYSRAAWIGEKGEVSAGFTNRVLMKTYELPSGSRVFIIDRNYNMALSPSRLVSYGFNALLNLYHPHKYLRGEIIPPHKVSEIEPAPNNVFFTWDNGNLKE